MNEEKLKNIVVLKNLPSNIIEEAIVILKPNTNINLIDKEEKKYKYIIDEANMVITNYVRKSEKQSRDKKTKIIEKKYKKVSVLNKVLIGLCIIGVVLKLVI